MIRLYVLAAALLASPALAQQPMPQQMAPPTPSQVALQIDTVVNGWAQQIENLQRQNVELEKQVQELKAKYEAPKKE